VMYDLTPYVVGAVAGALVTAAVIVAGVGAWVASEKARFLGSRRELEAAHAGLTERLEALKRRSTKARVWFGRKKGRG